MNNTLKIVLSTLVWCGLLAYAIFAVRLCSQEKQNNPLAKVEIEIVDQHKHRLITKASVEKWLEDEGYVFSDSTANITDINTRHIRTSIENYPLIKNADVYTDMSGTLHIEITQRKPIARFNTSNGYNFYLSDDGYVLPITKDAAMYLPIVTGTVPLPFPTTFQGSISQWAEENQKKTDQNYLYLLNLINFVKLIGNSTFWNAQIVQVNVESKNQPDSPKWKEPLVELIPRIGKHIVILGSLENTQDKLEKLMLFYKKALDYEGWEQYRTIDLRYKDQIVCRQ